MIEFLFGYGDGFPWIVFLPFLVVVGLIIVDVLRYRK